VLERLLRLGISVSVDSHQPETQRYALGCGVDYLNDIRGFPEPAFYGELAAATCKLVVMHSVAGRERATRAWTDPATVVERVVAFLGRRIKSLEAARIDRDRLIVDPGMGFFLGSNPEASLVVLRNLDRLRAFGVPVWLSVSRKSFLGALTGRRVGARGPATLAAELYAASRGADYVRTHDPGALRDALTVLRALERE
jgi:dihydropteroate synthase type 2